MTNTLHDRRHVATTPAEVLNPPHHRSTKNGAVRRPRETLDMGDTSDRKPRLLPDTTPNERRGGSLQANKQDVKTLRDLKKAYGIRFVACSDDLRGTNVLAEDVSADAAFLSAVSTRPTGVVQS